MIVVGVGNKLPPSFIPPKTDNLWIQVNQVTCKEEPNEKQPNLVNHSNQSIIIFDHRGSISRLYPKEPHWTQKLDVGKTTILG